MQDRSRPSPLLLLALSALGGCASWAAHGLLVRPPARLRIAVVQKGALDPSREARALFELRLSSSPAFEVVPDRETDEALAANGLSASASLSPQAARYLGRVLGAQAILTLAADSYGKPPPGLLATALGSRTVLAGVAGWGLAELWVPWAGAGLAIFDQGLALSEWVLGHPVLLRAELWSVADGQKVWSRTSFSAFGRSAENAVDKAYRSLERASRR